MRGELQKLFHVEIPVDFRMDYRFQFSKYGNVEISE